MVLEDRVTEAKEDIHVLNDLLSEYKPFIQKIVYETCKRYVEWGRDEELQIGLMAFEETVKRYERDKGNFLSFARQIIKSRVIDYLRKENKHRHIDIDKVGDSAVEDDQTNLLIVDEIDELKLYLKRYNISFSDLPELSPVKRTLREELKIAAEIIADDSELMNQLLEKKQLPVRALAKQANISYKKIERNRVYVITMALIWYLDLPLLREFVKVR